MINPWNKIVEVRTQTGLSQAEFAKSLGYSKGYIANIETERTKPSRRFLEAICHKYAVSMDWLFQDSQILDLIESNKQNADPDLIFAYAFTQAGIDEGEKYLKKLLKERQCIFVDAAGKTLHQLFKTILNKKGRTGDLLRVLIDMMLTQEVILMIKNMSSSKISESGSHIKSIFKVLDDASYYYDRMGEGWAKHEHSQIPKSSLIVLDFPSYLEKNMQSGFGYYAFPIYIGEKRGHNK